MYPSYTKSYGSLQLCRALVASPSMVRSSPMRTSIENIPSLAFCQWPTLAPTRKRCTFHLFETNSSHFVSTATAPNSSSPPLSLAGSMASTLSSVRSLTSSHWLLSRLLRPPAAAVVRSTTTRSQPSSSLVFCKLASSDCWVILEQ